MSLELVFYIKTTIVFVSFTSRQPFLINWSCNDNLFQIIQHSNFRILNRVIFTLWKHLELWVNIFWCYFKVIRRCKFDYLMKSVPIPRNKSSFEIVQLFDTWRHQSSVTSRTKPRLIERKYICCDTELVNNGPF